MINSKGILYDFLLNGNRYQPFRAVVTHAEGKEQRVRERPARNMQVTRQESEKVLDLKLRTGKRISLASDFNPFFKERSQVGGLLSPPSIMISDDFSNLKKAQSSHSVFASKKEQERLFFAHLNLQSACNFNQTVKTQEQRLRGEVRASVTGPFCNLAKGMLPKLATQQGVGGAVESTPKSLFFQTKQQSASNSIVHGSKENSLDMRNLKKKQIQIPSIRIDKLSSSQYDQAFASQPATDRPLSQISQDQDEGLQNIFVGGNSLLDENQAINGGRNFKITNKNNYKLTQNKIEEKIYKNNQFKKSQLIRKPRSLMHTERRNVSDVPPVGLYTPRYTQLVHRERVCHIVAPRERVPRGGNEVMQHANATLQGLTFHRELGVSKVSEGVAQRSSSQTQRQGVTHSEEKLQEDAQSFEKAFFELMREIKHEVDSSVAHDEGNQPLLPGRSQLQLKPLPAVHDDMDQMERLMKEQLERHKAIMKSQRGNKNQLSGDW